MFNFLAHHFKWLALGAGVGAILALLIWSNYANYRATLYFPVALNGNGDIHLIESDWADLAGETAAEPNLSKDDKQFYQTLSNRAWWKGAVSNNYPINKSASENLRGAPGFNAPVNLEINWVGPNRLDDERQVIRLANFISNATYYIAIRDLLTKYISEESIADVLTERDLNSAKLKLNLASRRLVNLEWLQRRFGSNGVTINQLFDPGQSGAKYLPISSQIIAAKLEIFDLHEEIAKLQNSYEQITLLRQFLSQAKSLIETERNGKKLAEQLLEVESQLRFKITVDDYSALASVDRIRAELTDIKVRHSAKAAPPLNPLIVKTFGFITATLLGLMGGFLVTALLCFGVQYLPKAGERIRALKNRA